jgi:hypothetical protein
MRERLASRIFLCDSESSALSSTIKQTFIASRSLSRHWQRRKPIIDGIINVINLHNQPNLFLPERWRKDFLFTLEVLDEGGR